MITRPYPAQPQEKDDGNRRRRHHDPKPLTIRRDDNVQKAINIMDRNRIKRLFIVGDSRVESVVSRADPMELFAMTG